MGHHTHLAFLWVLGIWTHFLTLFTELSPKCHKWNFYQAHRKEWQHSHFWLAAYDYRKEHSDNSAKGVGPLFRETKWKIKDKYVSAIRLLLSIQSPLWFRVCWQHSSMLCCLGFTLAWLSACNNRLVGAWVITQPTSQGCDICLLQPISLLLSTCL